MVNIALHRQQWLDVMGVAGLDIGGTEVTGIGKVVAPAEMVERVVKLEIVEKYTGSMIPERRFRRELTVEA